MPWKVAVARRRNGSDGVASGTVAAARDGYQIQEIKMTLVRLHGMPYLLERCILGVRFV